MRAADAAWVDRRRWDLLSGNELKSFTALTPEFVIEVRSDSERLGALREKMESWIANGAELAWLIDPERRVVEIYRPGEAPEVHEDPTSVQGSGCVRGFELVMARVWG
jgi:Uma2 family endonuclease